MSVVHHTLDIYGAELHLVTTKRDWTALRKRLRASDAHPADFLDPTPDAAGLSNFALLHPKDGSFPIPHLVLWIDRKQHKTQLDLIETCAHEAAHGADQILDWTGHTIAASDEPHAYLVGWLTRWMLEQVGDVA